MRPVAIGFLAFLFGNAAFAAAPGTGELEWFDKLKDGQKHAMEKRQPMLVILGADWCPPCRLLDKEIAKPEVQEKLKTWTRVHLDVDTTPNAAELLGGRGAIPHLKVMTATGRTVASQTGFMKADELLKWLAANLDEALAGAAEELTSTAIPTAAELSKLFEHLKQPEPALREAAIKRLISHPKIAAGGAVDALAKGNLATRLSALELFIAWRAPVEGIDPWRQETISRERLDALRAWAESRPAKTRPATRPA